MATHKVFFVNLPEALGQEIERSAKAENKTPDQFVQEAVERKILIGQHEALKRFGQANARARGITEADLPLIIAESRAETAKSER